MHFQGNPLVKLDYRKDLLAEEWSLVKPKEILESILIAHQGLPLQWFQIECEDYFDKLMIKERLFIALSSIVPILL